MESFTIDRKIWLRGEGYDKSWLLRSCDEKMCCIGQYALAKGVDKEALRGIVGLGSIASQYIKNLKFINSNELSRFYFINDREDLTDSEREAKLIDMFLAQGYTVTFMN